MPFDPSLPADHSPLVSAEMRGQFTGLKTLIDAGVPGPPGPPFATVIVDGVGTLLPGSPATVTASFDGANVHLTFGIPAGSNGTDGSNGTNGTNGEVSTLALNAAIAAALASAAAASSANANAVATLNTGYMDPASEELRQKLNELILALRR